MEKQVKNIAYSLYLALKNKSQEEQKKIFDNLASYLKKKKKEYLLGAIFKKFVGFYLAEKKAEIILARDFKNEAIVDKIKDFARKELGKKEIFELKIEKSLIGGFVIKDKKYQIKASIRDFLYQVKK